MSSFASNFTPRWRGKYHAAGLDHTLQLRGARGTSFGTMDGYRDRAREIFDAIFALTADDFEWIESAIALTDSDFFTPGTTPVIGTAPTFDAALFSKTQKATGTTFSGSAAGSRGRFTLFGIFWAMDTIGSDEEDAVVTAAEVPAIGSIVGTANTFFHAGSGALAGWHARATIKVNDHLLKKVRSGVL
jgi:hypothetical protein